MQAAESFWKEGVSLLGKVRKPSNEQKVVMMQMEQNIAIACNKYGNHKGAIQAATGALEINEKAEKALMQRSVAYMKLQEWDLAFADCKAAIQIDPKSKAFRDQWDAIKAEKSKASQGERAAMQKMFA